MQDEDEVVVGYLIQREDKDGEITFWDPTNEWLEDPNEAKLYEKQEEAEADAKSLQEGDTDGTVTIELVFEADDEDWDDEEDAEEDKKA
ncbi:hypothetical protein [Acetobacter indonesiensis]|uniref:Uncharacterized protein n=1 Tax=Acetobacter indonesiensis TaxID=104101 RepID=A0A6N3T6T9_9PROT|nr:hypothetical protein [Acetobacter indonesiensis]MCG0994730.1 hypothetical protein [Acetobacter indonesiensis]MCI1437591.1 hypothetical protein [Acetobacter indonesiensis]MCI1546608.1 hypothetical protein [Acetobacter indonesiensis]MCI1765891.1 hypothetical protein [Acetobacter indonesiensis]MCP1229974.1 hypothetical protein [Acetobacter indonesiensis]